MDLFLKELAIENKEEVIKMCQELSQDNKEDNFEGMSNQFLLYKFHDLNYFFILKYFTSIVIL